MAAKLRTLRPTLRSFDARSVKPEAKTVDPFYLTPEYQAWREKVIGRAGGRCEAIERGMRCAKAQPQHRMFADHIKERRDQGAGLDPANGQCLCGSHHTLKTAAARATRFKA
jgi:5-methylcytosine-specific restriction protein A